MPLDNLTDLLVFIRVADACSFTLAAERLGISRSAAGKCVNRLEERLATRLLQRTTRSVSLTEDGAVFYEYAQRILSQAEEAETALNTRRQTPRGRLRLDLPVSLGRLHILPILREFLAQWPEVDADVSFSDEYSDLVRDGIDVAIRVGGSDDSRLVRRVLAPHRRRRAGIAGAFNQRRPDGCRAVGRPSSGKRRGAGTSLGQFESVAERAAFHRRIAV